MELNGLYQIKPHDEDLLVRCAKMAGEAYLEERWMMTLLEGLPPESRGRDRERYLAEAFVLNEFAVFAPYQGVYCLEDGSALAQATLKSELSDLSSAYLEEKAWNDLVKSVLTDDEAECLDARMKAMKPISNFDWMETDDDYIHFIFFAVASDHRGSGAFRKLLTPFLDYADEAGIHCYLETYSETLEGLYEHFGFHTVKRFESPEFPIVERAMVREPNA